MYNGLVDVAAWTPRPNWFGLSGLNAERCHVKATIQLGFLLLATVLHTIARAAIGAAWKETETRYAERLGGSSRIIRAAGRIIKPRGRLESVT